MFWDRLLPGNPGIYCHNLLDVSCENSLTYTTHTCMRHIPYLLDYKPHEMMKKGPH